MSKNLTHAEMISLWNTVGDLAAVIGEKETVCRGWKLRNSIPSKHWSIFIAAAKKRGFDDAINAESLLKNSAGMVVA